MRTALAATLALCAAACGSEGPRRTFKIPLEGQSPPEPVKEKPPEEAPAPPPVNSTQSVSSEWLYKNAPFTWTAPPGWEAVPATAPTKILDVTLEKNGPGNAPIQFMLLYGADDQPDPMRVKQYNYDRAVVNYQQDTPMQPMNRDHDGIRVVINKVHGKFEGYPKLGASEPINEPNWTLYFGWAEGSAGSVMFKMQGPDAIMNLNEPKLFQFLDSLRNREKK